MRRLRARTLAAAAAKLRFTDESTYLVKKTGCCNTGAAAAPPPPPPPPPIYNISCGDTIGTQVLPTLPSTSFFLSPTAPGVGVALIQYRDIMSNILYQTVIQTNIGPVLLPAPLAGTTSILYTFRCTPDIIDVACNSEEATNSWQPLQFHNTAAVSVYISFTPNTVESQWIDPDELSTTVVGITYYNVVCPVTTFDVSCGYAGETLNLQLYKFHNRELFSVYISFTPGTVASQWIDPSGTTEDISGINSYTVACDHSTFRLDVSSSQIVVGGTTISIYNPLDKAAAIQFYNAEGGLVVVGPGANTAFPILTGTTGYPIVPATAVHFTATAAVLYDVSECGLTGYLPPDFPAFPLLFICTATVSNITGQLLTDQQGGPYFVDDLYPNPFIPGSVQLLTVPPGNEHGTANIFKAYCG